MLAPSIGETMVRINDTSWLDKNFVTAGWGRRVCLWLICLWSMGAGWLQPQELPMADTKQEMRDGYVRTADLFAARALHNVDLKWKAFSDASHTSGALPVSGLSLVLGKNKDCAKIDGLVASKYSQAQDVLDVLREYYKALLAVNCVRAAFAESSERGQSMLAAVNVFGDLFDPDDNSCGMYDENILQQQADFIKLTRELVGCARLVAWHPFLFKKRLEPCIKSVFKRFDAVLPQCVTSDEHVVAMCHRCAATQVLHLVQEGILRHGTWGNTSDSHGLENAVILSAVVGTVAVILWARS